MTDLERVQQDWSEIRFIANPTDEVCREAVRQNGYALMYIIEQTPELCELAVKTVPDVISWARYLTIDMCVRAVLSDPECLVLVPESMILDVCERAGKYLPKSLCHSIMRHSARIRGLSDDDLDRYVAETAARCPDGVAIDDEYQRAVYVLGTEPRVSDIDIVRGNWRNLESIKNQTEEVCLAAIQCCPDALYFVRDKTTALCDAALSKDGDMLRYVDNQTHDICITAVSSFNYNALLYVKEQTDEICIEAVRSYPRSLQYVKEQTEAICKEAVSRDGTCLRYVRNKTYDVCLEAVLHSCEAIEYMSEQTEELCREAVLLGPSTLQYVKNKTFDLCLLAASESALSNIPHGIRSEVEESLKSVKVFENSIHGGTCLGIAFDVIAEAKRRGIEDAKDILAFRDEMSAQYNGADNIINPWRRALTVLGIPSSSEKAAIEHNKLMQELYSDEGAEIVIRCEAMGRGFIDDIAIVSFRDELADSYFGDSSITDPWEKAYKVLKGE